MFFVEIVFIKLIAFSKGFKNVTLVTKNFGSHITGGCSSLPLLLSLRSDEIKTYRLHFSVESKQPILFLSHFVRRALHEGEKRSGAYPAQKIIYLLNLRGLSLFQNKLSSWDTMCYFFWLNSLAVLLFEVSNCTPGFYFKIRAVGVVPL